MQSKDYSNARATSYRHLGYICTAKPLSNALFPLLHPDCSPATSRASSSMHQTHLPCTGFKGASGAIPRKETECPSAGTLSEWQPRKHPLASLSLLLWFHQCFPTARSCFVTLGHIKWFHSLHFWSPRNTVVKNLGINPNLNTKCTNYLPFNSGQAKLHPALCPSRCCSNFHCQ